MVKELISKSEFARRAGVVPSAVTKALRSSLKASMVGKRIDVSHPCAVKYIQNKAVARSMPKTEPAPGIDPLYEQAVQACSDSQRYTPTFLAAQLHIGKIRAKKILDMMAIAGLHEPTPNTPKPKKEKFARGHVAKNNTKKAKALTTLNDSVVEEVEQGRIIHEVPDDIKAFADMTLRELIHRFGTDTAFVDWLKATKSIEDINEKRLKNAVTRGELVNRDLIKSGVIDPINTAMQRLLTDGSKTMARRVTAMSSAGRTVDDCEKFIIDQISSFIGPMKAKIKRSYKNA